MASRALSRRWFLRDLPRAYVILVWAAFVAAILAYFIDWSPPIRRETAAQPQQTAVNSDTVEKLYSGSILIPTRRHDQCWEIMFDNRTGYMRNGGYVNCNKAALQMPELKLPPSAEMTRLREVRKAFRNK
jgi:hypothetical protein